VGSHAENMKDKERDGTLQVGAKNPMCRLTKENVKEMWENRENYSKAELSRKYKVSETTIGRIFKGENWAHITGLQKVERGERKKKSLETMSQEEYDETYKLITAPERCERINNSKELPQLPDDNLRKIGCLKWTNARNDTGYGYFLRFNITYVVHRLMYMLTHGITELPEDQVVRHLCNNEWCFEPSHLLIGTHKDNCEDKRRTGTLLTGENVHNAQLSNDDVKTILQMRDNGETVTSIYEHFQDKVTSRTTISGVFRHDKWKSVKENL